MVDKSTLAGDSLVTIEFRPQNKVTRVPPGMSIFNAANWIGLAIDSTCGGRGTCGKCKIRLLPGTDGRMVAVTDADREVFDETELAAGWRLSCRAVAQGETICEVPQLMGNPKAALMGYDRHIKVDPNVHKVVLELPKPSLEDQRGDFTRIREALKTEGFEISTTLALQRRLPHVLRESGWRITAVVVGDELITVEPGDTAGRSYGLAFDIGTTTVVGMLMDLNSGAPAAVRSALNGQAVFGADVIARISHAMLEEGGLAELTDKIVETLNGLIEKLLSEAGVETREVYEVTVVGNATMLHLFLGLDPQAIGVMPFIPVADDLLTVHAYEARLQILPQALVHCLPHIGAYVGADLVGGLLATGLAQKEGVRLLVDVGTNGEIILGSATRTVATSAPAGPAFEGAQISDGMRATNGAIEAVTITRDSVKLQVIGEVPPIGVCGSGLLDIAAQLRLVGLLDSTGRFVTGEGANSLASPEITKRLVWGDDGMVSFVLAWPDESGNGRQVALTQRDIRELQFAKGAIASGIEVVMEELGVTKENLQEIYLAGSFGSYINPQSARIIGLVPPVPVERIKAVGNAAGEGAKMTLISFRQREVARSLSQIVEYHELSGRADFNDSFLAVLQFPKLSELNMTGPASTFEEG